MKITLKLVVLSILASFLVFGSAARAEYPEKPVTFIVPWPPGDLEDVVTRLIAEEFQKEYGVAAAVVNKPGGGGGPFPGAAEVANAPADGYTIGSFVVGVPIIGPLVGVPGFEDPDLFEPVGIFIIYPFLLAASGDAPYSNMAELAEYAKSHKVALGHFGHPLIPTKATFVAAMELGFEFGSDAAFDMNDCNTLASGDADVINTTAQLVLPCLDDLKVLATFTGDQRTSVTPNVATLSEQVPGIDVPTLWNGLFVKKGTPQIVKDKLAAVAKRVIAGDAVAKVAKNTGGIFFWEGPAEAKARIARDWKTTESMMKKLGQLD